MNDLEICRRIAEIEGIEYFSSEGIISAQNELGMCREYNPLTDDALCFQLMIKYRMEVFPIGKTFWCAWDSINLNNRKNSTHVNKAICLAIIEGNK